jgi:hypothetical protein
MKKKKDDLVVNWQIGQMVKSRVDSFSGEVTSLIERNGSRFAVVRNGDAVGRYDVPGNLGRRGSRKDCRASCRVTYQPTLPRVTHRLPGVGRGGA